jgi:hypothetical protein
LRLPGTFEAHLLNDDAAVLDLPPRHDLQAVDERRRLGPRVCLDEPNDDVDAPLPERVRLLEHAVRLAHARGEADVQLQAPALPPLDELEEVIRARAAGGCRHRGQSTLAGHRLASGVPEGTIFWHATCCFTPK